MEKPPIRILQRPCPISSNQPAEPVRPPAKFKTLEQREADYAAARERIMGSDSPDVSEVPLTKESLKCTANGNGLYGSPAPRQTSAPTTGSTTPATPLMSIQASPVSSGALTSDLCLPAKTTSSGVQSRANHGARQSLAVVNVTQKLQQPQLNSNGTRPVIQTQQTQRLMTASSSSPSLFPQSSRANQPMSLFHSQVGTTNAGLLPTPPGFNYSLQNATLNTTLHHSQSAALALMHQFNLLQQQYQQTLNGFQNSFISPGASPNSFNHLNLSSINSQSTTNQKHAHPPTFN